MTASYGSQNELVKTLVIQPATVDILWEAIDSYTPPFYKGKPLAARESRVKLVAMPEVKSFGGKLHQPTDLVYEWEKDGEIQQRASGYGNQYFSFLHGLLENEQRITVTAKSRDGYSQASGWRTVDFVSPIIGLYQEHTREGVDFTKELTQKRNSVTGQVSLVAVPYHFSTTGNDLDINWRVNERNVSPSNQKNKITIQKSGEEGGVALVEVVIENIARLFQEDSRVFEINLN